MAPLDLEAPRRVAFAIGYRMLGTVEDAEDIAQEAITRLARADDPPDNPDAWVTTVATRLSIDVLRSARVQREAYVGPWLPEPLLEDPASGPGERAELADTLSQALLVALERLTPVERAAFLLREAFDYDYGRIAQIIDRTEVNARQLVVRAKKHVSAERPRFDPDEAARARLLRTFLGAVDDGDLRGLESMLAEDVVLWGDGGGKVLTPKRTIHGASDVARFLVHSTAWRRKHGQHLTSELATVNGQPGQILREEDGSVYAVLSVDIVDGRVVTMRMMRNPEKLAHIAAAPGV